MKCTGLKAVSYPDARMIIKDSTVQIRTDTRIFYIYGCVQLIFNKMKNSKVYFKLERDFNTDIEIIANNEIDLKSYLSEIYEISVESINVSEKYCAVKLPNDTATYYPDISWVLCV